ncbi:MAG: SAM-dependent DNA methyltransferase [Kiritimatiellae bacterium]|nr:SAM-dependent DNA methyltransferase [Kiritimatiellia bacterium]
MDDSSHAQMVSLIWNIADDVLRDVFLRGQYRDVILPMIVLRRLDALLEPTKAEVDAEVKENGVDADVLFDITKLPYFNTSKWTLNILKAQATDDEKILLDNFNEYLLGFSENVRDVLRKFGFISKDGTSPAEKAQKLSDNHRLLSVIERVTDTRINLTDRAVRGPDGLMIPPLDNIGMGKVFEELLRRFNEENNEEAGEHFTPRDAIMLLTRLIFEPVKDNLPKTFSLYDPACGSGGMLTESQRYLTEVLKVDPAAIFLSGTEVNPETYAICKSDLIIKGTDAKNIRNGNTITQLEKVFADDGFAQKRFGYMITNPPYGKSWKEDEKKIYHENELLDDRFRLKLVNFAGEEVEVDATPRTSDGQLLFILEMLSKMTPLESQPQGTRIASVHNGSALFTGDAGSGESDTRRYLLENDLVEAIVQLPNNIFYNTGITTYVWIITNNKEDRRKGKIQLIDASQAFEKLRKNQGQRNCMIDEKSRDMILAAYMAFEPREATADNPVECKIFSNDDFRYCAVTVERPLRLRAQFTALKIDALRHDAKDVEFSQYLYSTFGEKVYEGLTEADKTAVKEYLQEAEIKKTDKQLKPFFEAAKWRERRALMEAAKAIKEKVGEEVFMDYNAFLEKVIEAAPKGVTAAQCKTIARAMAMPDPAAERVVKSEVKSNAKALKELCGVYGVPEGRLADYGYFPTDRGTYITYEPDTDLRDGEKIPVKEDIWEYFQREVRPYAEDAWIDLPKTKIGCEISFTKHFYKPQPLRTLEENEADLRKEAESNAAILKELLG